MIFPFFLYTCFVLTLTVNTSSFTESVALFTREKVLDEIKWRGAFDETEKLLPTIMRLLKNSKKKNWRFKTHNCCKRTGTFFSFAHRNYCGEYLKFLSSNTDLFNRHTDSLAPSFSREKCSLIITCRRKFRGFRQQ